MNLRLYLVTIVGLSAACIGYKPLFDITNQSGVAKSIVYPVGNTLLADVNYFGEQPYAPIQNTLQNASHGQNLILDPAGKLHFAYSNNGTTKYQYSTDYGATWTNNDPTSARTNKASKIDLLIDNNSNILIVGKHDVFDFDGNQITGGPTNYTREVFEAFFDGTAWTYQGIKHAFNFNSNTYGYISTLDNSRDHGVPLVLRTDGNISLAATEGGWFYTGYNLYELRRDSGTWNTSYAATNFSSDGVVISNNSGPIDSNLNTPIGSLTKADGTQYVFYNSHYRGVSNYDCIFSYRSRPAAGSWSAQVQISTNAWGLAAVLDSSQNIHVIYGDCSNTTGANHSVYYRFNFGVPELVASEGADFVNLWGDLFISASGKVTAAWDVSPPPGGLTYKDIRINERNIAGVWGTATDLTGGYTGYGKNSPFFVRGNRWDIFPARRQLIYNENYNDGTDKKRIMLYTWPAD